MDSIVKMKSFEKLVLVVISVFLFQVSYSQQNFQLGYIIDQNRDTIKGYVDYRNWSSNPDEIIFKKGIENESISYKPNDIIEFGVEDEIYNSGIVKIEVTPFEVDKLTEDPQLKCVDGTVFLQSVFNGSKSLYFYKSNQYRSNFYIKQDSVFELLVYKRYLRQNEGKSILTENKKFVGQLMLYLNDCPSLNSKIGSTSYELASLSSLFQKYYDCISTDTAIVKKRETIRGEFGVLAGVSLSSLSFSGSESLVLVNTTFSNSTNFTGGIFLDLILPRDQRKWSINNELLYTSYQVDGTYEDFESADVYQIIHSEFDYSYVKLNTMLRYRYPVGSGFVFVNAGMSNGIAFNESSMQTIEKRFYSTLTTEEGEVLVDARKYEQGFLLGVGARKQNLSIEFRYEAGNGMSNYQSLISSSGRLFFLLGYRF